MTRGSARRLAALLATGVVLMAAGGCGEGSDPPTRLERDLAGLRSSDGLYTAPQIVALAGNSLGETAYATAALAQLGQPTQLSVATARGLKPSPDDGEAWNLWYRYLLSRAGAPVAKPAPRQLRAVWRTQRDADGAVDASASLTILAETSRGAGIRFGQLEPRTRALISRVATESAREPSATVQLRRLELQRFAGEPADPAMARALTGRAANGLRGEDRAIESSSVVELGALLGRAPDQASIRRARAAAIKAATPASAYALVRALARAGQPLSGLDPVRRRLKSATGRAGAVRERAVFPGLPKAVWLVAQIRDRAGAAALPDAATARVSRAVPEASTRGRSDPDAAAYLQGAAKLAGLEYEDTSLIPPEPPATRVRSAPEASTWSQRAALAGVLERRVGAVRVTPFALRAEPDIGAAAALFATADDLSARVVAPRAWKASFRRRAAQQRFRSARAATQAAAALAALGDRRAADRIVARDVRLGCGRFTVLVSDRLGECDLESTLVLLRIRDDVPAAGKLAKRMTARR